MRVLMLTDRDVFGFKSDTIEPQYCELYKSSIWVKILRNISVFSGMSLGDWKDELHDYDLIFCIDSTITISVLKWLCKHKGKTRLILYFRNKFYEGRRRWNLSEIKSLPLEIWSYNIHDCEKYGFKYNSQVLNYTLFDGVDNKDIHYSIAFVGANKGRDIALNEIYDHIDKERFLQPYFYMIGAGNREWNRCKDKEYLSYSEYLGIASKSLAVLDLVSEENKGLTFRPLEAMFLRKKLITNYTEITQYDFYRKDNVFIVGVDEWNSLDAFLSSPYDDIPEEIVKSYTTDEWIKRFI